MRSMGLQRVGVLNGGLTAWAEEGGELSGDVVPSPNGGDFSSRPQAEGFVNAETVLQRLSLSGERILDARSRDRYEAAHMPGAENLPYTELLDQGRMISPGALKSFFQEGNLTCSCGSGVTACIVALAAKRAGVPHVSVYDASWSQWGAEENWPKESSEA